MSFGLSFGDKFWDKIELGDKFQEIRSRISCLSVCLKLFIFFKTKYKKSFVLNKLILIESGQRNP